MCIPCICLKIFDTFLKIMSLLSLLNELIKTFSKEPANEEPDSSSSMLSRVAYTHSPYILILNLNDKKAEGLSGYIGPLDHEGEEK